VSEARPASDATGDATSRRPPDRRARRRQDTIREIVDIALEVMTEEGVNGLSLAEVARRLGVQPPSLYKYFPSLMAIYDALFRRGQEEHLGVVRDAMSTAELGLAAIVAGLEAGGRWVIANPALGQLMFWRPVPNFEPSPEALAPSGEMVALYRAALGAAVAGGELGPEVDSDEAVLLLSVLIAGVMSQHMANEPHAGWSDGRFTSLFPRVMQMFIDAFPASATPRERENRGRRR
jgi:AcrR family transcriptional regulator